MDKEVMVRIYKTSDTCSGKLEMESLNSTLCIKRLRFRMEKPILKFGDVIGEK